jgi:hypothetical protein
MGGFPHGGNGVFGLKQGFFGVCLNAARRSLFRGNHDFSA